MLCPSCGKECWDNTQKNIERTAEGKKNLPQYSCKDKEGCGWIMWPDKKGTKTILRENGPLPIKNILHPDNNIRERTMILSYAKDIVVAELSRDQIVGAPGKEVIAIYRELCSEVFNPLK